MFNKLSFAILGVAVAFFLPLHADANTQALTNLQNYSGVNPIQTSCNTCHTSPPALNAFGSRFLALGGSKPAYVLNASAQSTLFAEDTDGDGTNNLAELQAGTNPAGANAGGGQQKASVTGCVVGTLSTWLMMFLAMLSLVFVVQRKH